MAGKDQDEFMQFLLNDFKIESAEHYQTILDGILELEGDPDDSRKGEIVEEIFRVTHSLKGAARVINSKYIEKLCMKLESIFNSLKKKEYELNTQMFDLFNKSLNVLNKLLRDIDQKNTIADFNEWENVISELDFLHHSASAGASFDNGPFLTATVEKPVVSQPTPESAKPTEVEPDQTVNVIHPKTVLKNRERPKQQETIRVSTPKLKEIMQLSEELITLKSSLEFYTKEIQEVSFEIGMHRSNALKDHSTTALDEARLRTDQKIQILSRDMEQFQYASFRLIDDLLVRVKSTLFQPLKPLFAIVPKIIRDLSRDMGKEIECRIIGEEIEIDKRIIEELKDPLVHLIRNAADHGIEMPTNRESLGKKRCATITISASLNDNRNVVIQVGDDGGGIDKSKVLETAIKSGLISREDVSKLTDSNIYALLFKSGFSTSQYLTDISGRGLGMAIVEEKILQLGGSIDVQTTLGKGTTFSLTLPQTISTYRGILVDISGQTFSLPTLSVDKALRVRPTEIKTVESKRYILHHDESVSLVSLSDVLNIPKIRNRKGSDEFIQILIIHSSNKKIALVVDTINEEHEGVVKELGPQLIHVKAISGVTLLGDGKIVPIIDVPNLLSINSDRYSDISTTAVKESQDDEAIKKILVADDSITIRSMLRSFIENAGYIVKTAVDGLDAFNQLQNETFNLVVSDVEMPNMNGFELSAKIRENSNFSEIPVILVTSLETADDRQRGLESGANAYIVKGDFEKSNLIETIQRLI